MRDADDIARFAREQIAGGSQSFAAAARLFEPAIRRDVVMLYAWCRHCDDVIDGQLLGHQGSAEPHGTPHERLQDLEARTRAAFGPEPAREPAFRALQIVAHRGAMPEQLALDHLEGFRMDVEERRYETIEDLLDYCYHVAGVVGVMMARIMNVRDPATLVRAADLGLAFQLTNIARDIVPDAEAGRVYLPAAWLRDVGIAPDDIAQDTSRPALAILARRLVQLAEPYYASARIGIGALPRRSAWAIATALGVYRQIGLLVVDRGARAWDRRASTRSLQKLRHVTLGGAIALGARPAPAARPATLWTHSR